MGIAAPLLLGIDVGTTHAKVVLVDAQGAEVRSAVRPTPFERGPAGVEADPGALLATVACTVGDLGGRIADVVAVGIAGLAESGACLDRHEQPIGPVIAWHDPRGAEAVAALEDRFGEALSVAIGQQLRTVSSVAKLGWSAANGVGDVRWWLGVPELCLHRLTGAKATDYSLAARSGAYDVGRRAPMPEVPAALGLPGDVFPEPSPAGTVMGAVSADGAAWSGLPAGIPVTVAGHDHLAGVTGSGCGADDLGNSVGTAEVVVGRARRLPDVRAALAARTAVTLTPEGDEWAVLASGARAGLVLDLAGRVLGRALAELDERSEHAGLVDAASWVDGAVEALRAADARPVAGYDRGLPPGPPGAVWNGVLRALAARTWDAARRVEQLRGPGRRLVVFGGGARSGPWLRAKASVGHLPVVRSTVGEAGARGAAVHAGVAAGWWPSAGAAPRPALDAVP